MVPPEVSKEAGVWSADPLLISKTLNDVKITDGAASMSEKMGKECIPCLMSPLGFHLHLNMKEKIWRGEFVDFAAILPPVRDNAKYDRKDEKAEDWRPVIKTFYGWLQAFLIYSSVLCEKYPEKSSLLFQHIDIILEAYRGFSGSAWLAYDEAFRQKLAVQPSLQWGSKDVGLWLNLFLPQRQPFARPSTVSAPQTSSANSYKKGLYFAFNDSQCRWLNTCKFKHESAFCAGNHSVSKCFRKLQASAREGFPKGSYTGDAANNATVVAGLPKPTDGFINN